MANELRRGRAIVAVGLCPHGDGDAASMCVECAVAFAREEASLVALDIMNSIRQYLIHENLHEVLKDVASDSVRSAQEKS